MRLAKENKKFSKPASEKKRKYLKWILWGSAILIFFLLLVVVYYSKNIILHSFAQQEKTVEKNKLFQLAEEAYQDGFLENSAVEYYNYLKTEPSKVDKILTYRRLFEISVLKKDYSQAFMILDDWELLDKNNPSIPILRLKLLLRTGKLREAKAEIQQYQNRLKKSPDFMELTAIYYMKIGDDQTALKTLLKIPQQKRGYEINKKIIHCYMKQNQLSAALAYIHKIEPLVRTFDSKQDKGEFFLLKSVVKILKGDKDTIFDEVRPSLLEPQLRPIGYKLLILSNIMQDRLNDLNLLLSEKDAAAVSHGDPDLAAIIGNYYVYRKSYSQAQFYYEAIKEKRKYTKQELLALSDIYFSLTMFDEAEKLLHQLNRDFDYLSKDYFKNISYLRWKQDDFSSAVHYLIRGKEEFPEDLDFYLRLAYLHGENGFTDAALSYLNEGMEMERKLKRKTHDKNFDLLRLRYAKDTTKKRVTELELLEMRGRPDADPDSYFHLIRFYLEQNRLFHAERELQTLEKQPLTMAQKNEYYGYKFLYALANGDLAEYRKIKEILDKNQETPLFYRAIIRLIDADYETVLDLLLELEKKTDLQDTDMLKRIFYLRALTNYYKKDYPAAYQALASLSVLDPNHKKASYLRTLLN